MYTQSENEHVKSILGKYVTAKRYYYDMLFDFDTIVKERKSLFQSFMTDYERLDLTGYFNAISYNIKKPKHKFRMYVVCGFRYISLAYIDVPLELAEQIRKDIDYELSKCEPVDSKGISPYFFGTVYMFKNSKITYRKDLDVTMVSFLLNALKDENLIDNSLELEWKNIF